MAASRPEAAILVPDVEKQVQETMEEARVVLPGMQALFGFQLIAVFNQKFQELTAREQLAHFASTLLVVLGIALIMTPAAYHRQVEPGKATTSFLKLASVFIAAAMVPLMLALSVEVYLLARIIIENRAVSIVLAGVQLAIFAGLWFVLPWIKRRRLKPHG